MLQMNFFLSMERCKSIKMLKFDKVSSINKFLAHRNVFEKRGCALTSWGYCMSRICSCYNRLTPTAILTDLPQEGMHIK